MCADMAQGRSAFKANGSRSASRWFASTRGSDRWLSTRARPWPGACLPTGCTPAASSPAANARPSRATARGSSANARSPMTACAPGMARSSTGAATTSNPAAAQSSPISAPVSQAARTLCSAAAGGCARQCGGRSRATRPPSWSTISTAPGGSTRRSSAISAASCAGSRMLRANRMTPHGCSARNSAASSADSAGPAIPTMAAFRTRPPSSRRPWRASSRRSWWPGATSLNPPVRTRHSVRPSCSVLLNAGLRWPSRSGRRLDSRCHSDLAASSECTAVSCTSVLPAADAAACFSAAGTATGLAATTGFGAAATAAGAGTAPRRSAAVPAVARAAPGARASRAAGRACRPSISVPPDRMSSSAPATCMPPGLSGFTRIGRLSACTTGTAVLRWPITDQPPTTTEQRRPSPPAIMASCRVAGSMPWR